MIFGGQSKLYAYSVGSNDTTIVYDHLDNPFIPSLDWVARRLIWVENGDTVCVCVSRGWGGWMGGVCMYASMHYPSPSLPLLLQVSKPLRIISGSVELSDDPQLVTEDPNIVSTAIDSRNG